MHQIFNKAYIFTNKKNPKWGIMSFILGLVAITSVCIAVYFTYQRKGAAQMQYGAAVLLAVIYAGIGLALGIRTSLKQDVYRFFPVAGIVFNTLAIAAGGFILYIGIN